MTTTIRLENSAQVRANWINIPTNNPNSDILDWEKVHEIITASFTDLRQAREMLGRLHERWAKPKLVRDTMKKHMMS